MVIRVGPLALGLLFTFQVVAIDDGPTSAREKYMQAQKSKKEVACNSFFELSKDTRFPLNDLASIRARQTCGPESEKVKDFDYKAFKNKPWLWPLAIDIAFEEKVNGNDYKSISELYLEKSKLIPLVNDKVDFTEKAIQFAKKAKVAAKDVIPLTQRLYNLAPRKKPRPTHLDWLNVATDFRRSRDFKNALKNYDKIVKNNRSSLDDKYRALLGVRATHKLMEDKPKFLKSAEALVKFCEQQTKTHKSKPVREKFLKRYYEAIIAGARANWTEGKVQIAIRTLERTEKEFKGKLSIDEVYWLRGRIEEEKKNYERAISWLEKSNTECKDECVLREKILWNLAWSSFKLKRYPDAINRFEHVFQVSENPFAKPKFKFWKGKSFQAISDAGNAEKVFQELTQEDPIGYYGFLAYRELKKEIPQPPKYVSGFSQADALEIKDSFSVTDSGKYAYWLISVGEEETAGIYLDSVFDILKQDKEFRNSQPRLLDFFAAYAHSNNFLKMFSQMAELPNDLRNQILTTAPGMAFPQPFNEVVIAAAKKYGVNSELIYAIMRQESSFNPNARSPADAFGLMQLVPRMAKAAAEKSEVRYKKETDLYDPKVNIPLGASYLKTLWQKYSGQFVLVSASYNASEKAIRNWIDTRYFDDPLLFIEDVPYEETQNYIKLVLRNYIYYSALNSQEGGLKFPDWALANLSDFRAKSETKRNPAKK